MELRGGHVPYVDNLGLLLINPRRAVERILGRVLGWAGLSDNAAFLKQNEIEKGIEECHRELATCTDRFMVCQTYAT
jgi:hypothetical protein